MRWGRPRRPAIPRRSLALARAMSGAAAAAVATVTRYHGDGPVPFLAPPPAASTRRLGGPASSLAVGGLGGVDGIEYARELGGGYRSRGESPLDVETRRGVRPGPLRALRVLPDRLEGGTARDARGEGVVAHAGGIGQRH